jgi:5-methylcytosine-specific restriction endonuclease McrA
VNRVFLDLLRYLRNRIRRRLRGTPKTTGPQQRQRKTRQRALYRLQVLIMLGGQCVCCQESDPAMLTIDHTQGHGTQERREYGGADYYRQMLANQRTPERLRILCQNCHHALNCWGACSHGQPERPTVQSELERAQRERAALLECKQDKLVA